MNCPYCDEATHPLAKFCSKCGLPLKEDTTVMGAYATDDTGPNPWVVGGGALAIVAIALTIGWLGSRRNDARPTETVRRDPVGSYPAPAGPGGLRMPSYTPMPLGQQAGYGLPGFGQAAASSRPSGPSATYNPSVRWAFNPSPLPPPRQLNWAPEPAAPPVLIASMNPIIYRRPTVVEPPVQVTPSIPPLPPDVVPLPEPGALDTTGGIDPSTLPPGYVVAPNGQVGTLNANGVFEPASDRAPAYAGDTRSTWVWDPVHERWAVSRDRTSRRSGRVGGRNVNADDQ